MKCIQELKQIVRTLVSKLEKEKQERIPTRRVTPLLTRIERHLKSCSNKIWEKSTKREVREKIVTSLDPVCQKLSQLSPSILDQLDFRVFKNLIKHIYLVGGVKPAKKLLNTLYEKISGDFKKISALADLTMDLGLFQDSIHLMSKLKKHGKIRMKEMYNLTLLSYMRGNTKKSWEIMKEMEKKSEYIFYSSSLKASINIALNRLDEAKKALGKR